MLGFKKKEVTQMWKTLIETESQKPYYKALGDFLESCDHVYPPENERFKAFELTPYDDVKVVILGQDPYHQLGQAMGLSFSVYEGTPHPKSLINIFKELSDDLGVYKLTGDLSGWAKQGVFLLNTILTVEDSNPLSHQNKGWEIFTDKVIEVLSAREKPMIFVLWGKEAQKKKAMIQSHHLVLESSHPSPLSSYRGFFGSKPFSTINAQLKYWGETPIDWSL